MKESQIDALNTLDAAMSEGLVVWRRFLRDGLPNDLASETDVICLIAETLPKAEGFTAVDWIQSYQEGVWCHFGFPLIDISSHTYASALACTDVADDPHLPWPCFVVRIPNGVIPAKSSLLPCAELSVTFVLVRETPDGCIQIRTGTGHGAYGATFSQAHRDDVRAWGRGDLGNEDLADIGIKSADDFQVRLNCASVRVALNAATALAQASHDGGNGLRHRMEPATEPVARRYALGKPIEADFREAVRDYVLGRRANLRKIYWMVRGHWRDQPHGPSSQLRRMQWIAPHWAKRAGAPDDAPVNLREHKL